MAYTEYFSTDASAPVINGVAGSLAAALDAILVNGYGSKAALGWGIAFTATNRRSYRAPTGNRMYFRLDDTPTTDARCDGWETMSDTVTGTGPFPTAAQLSGGLYIKKSTTANSTARPWYACGTDTWFFLMIFGAQTVFGNSASSDSTLFFGDCESLLPGDVYNTAIICRYANSTAGDTFGLLATAAQVGHYIARSYVGTIGAKQVGKLARTVAAGNPMGASNLATPYPDPISGKIRLSKVEIWESVTGGDAPRLVLPPQIRAPIIAAPGNLFDTIDGTGSLAGKSYRIIPCWNGSSTQGRFMMEIA